MRVPTILTILVLSIIPIHDLLAQQKMPGETGPAMTVTQVPNSENVTVSFSPGGTPMDDFFRVWSKTTGLNFFYPENLFRGKKVQGLGMITLHRAKLDDLLRSMITPMGFALIPTGPREANLFSVEQLDSSRTLKQRARFVPREELAEIADRTGEVFMTSYQLKHVDTSQARQAFQQILTNRSFEVISEVQNSNCIFMVGWGSTLAAVDDALRTVDVPAPENIRKQRELRRGARPAGQGR